MKILKKTVLIVLIVFFLLMIVLYLFISLRGKPILVSKLSEATGKKVTIESVGISPLLNIRVKNLQIEPILKVEHISASPSLIGLCFGKVILNDISVVRPQLVIEKKADLAAQPKSEGIQEQPQPSPRQQLDLQRFIVKRITARKGRLDFTDYTVGSSSGLKIIVEDINFSLKNTYIFPRSLLADFDLDGRIPWQEGTDEGKIKAEGWLDILKRDIQVTLKIQDIDGIYLYPYYAGWVDLGKARIEKARLNFTSNIQGLNNDVVAQCRLELTDIVRKPRGPDE